MYSSHLLLILADQLLCYCVIVLLCYCVIVLLCCSYTTAGYVDSGKRYTLLLTLLIHLS